MNKPKAVLVLVSFLLCHIHNRIISWIDTLKLNQIIQSSSIR